MIIHNKINTKRHIPHFQRYAELYKLGFFLAVCAFIVLYKGV